MQEVRDCGYVSVIVETPFKLQRIVCAVATHKVVAALQRNNCLNATQSMANVEHGYIAYIVEWYKDVLIQNIRTMRNMVVKA